MDMLLQNGQVYENGTLRRADVWIEDGVVRAVGENLRPGANTRVVSAKGMVVSPGFTDLHTHLRQPGFSAKETVASGSAAGAAGGFTTLCAMPNVEPVPHDLQALGVQMDVIDASAVVRVLAYGAITVREQGACLADIAGLAPMVVGFSDDGRGVQSKEIMRGAMREAFAAKAMIAAHCELEDLLPADRICVQSGSVMAHKLGCAGFSNESEAAEVERDIQLAEETGCRLHICHTSAAESLAYVRRAKEKGLPVSCEVTPHNLLLSCADVQDDGRFRMNPPLRGIDDRNAARQALMDGTVDAIATDHAPHTQAEKAGGFAGAMNGVVGLETAFASVYTALVKYGCLPLERLLHLLVEGPRRVLGEAPNALAVGSKADLVLLDLQTERAVKPEDFKTMGRATPFAGMRFAGWPVLTLYGGRVVYEREVDWQ